MAWDVSMDEDRSCALRRGRAAERTLDSWPDQLVDKLLLEVLDDHALGTDLLGLGLDCVVILILSLRMDMSE